jgi:hypothetical protein
VGHEPCDAAITVKKGMYPKEAMMRGRYRNCPSRFREALRIVSLGKVRQKRR